MYSDICGSRQTFVDGREHLSDMYRVISCTYKCLVESSIGGPAKRKSRGRHNGVVWSSYHDYLWWGMGVT